MKSNPNNQLNADKSGNKSNQKPAEIMDKKDSSSKSGPAKKDKRDDDDMQLSEERVDKKTSGDSRSPQSDSKTGKQKM